MLELLKQDAKVGDSLNLYLTSGDTVKGKIAEIGDNYLLLEVDGIKRRYFPQLIGGWDVVNETSLSITLNTFSNEKSVDAEQKDKEEYSEDEYNDVIITLLDKIFENENIDVSATIITNAVVDKVLPTGVSVITDSGEQITCHKGFMAGFSRANCPPGKRLFCGNVNNTGTYKGICYLSVLQMTFEEMRERFISALSAKPMPRKPIINSIIAYFRNNNGGKSTKKIIADLRNKVNLLGTSGEIGNSQLDKFIKYKQFDKAFELIERGINSAEDDKQKSALLLRKAQLYSSIKEHENAISAYRELISFNEKTNAPNKNLSHLYTELSRLLLLVGDKEQAESARNIALMLNPQNTIAKKIGSSEYDENKRNSKTAFIEENQKDYIQNSLIVKFTDKSLIDDDIDCHTFIDSEIVSLNGEVSHDIANRLLESANSSEDYVLHLETAKAIKKLPIGSYDVQDFEDSVNSYSIYKCRSLFSSYKKVVFESDSVNIISLDQINRIKDCAVNYSLETIENIINEDSETANNLLLNCLLLELSSSLISQKCVKDVVLEVLNFTLDKLVAFCFEKKRRFYFSNLFIKLVTYSIQCSNLWDILVLNSSQFLTLITHVNNNLLIKQMIFDLAPSRDSQKVIIYNSNFVDVFRERESNLLKRSFNQFTKIGNWSFNVLSVSSLQPKFSYLLSKKHVWCLTETDRKSLSDMNHFVSLLSTYRIRNKDERENILSNALLEVEGLIKWNSGATATKLGRFFFYPLLLAWKKTLSKLNVQSEYNDSCLLSLEVDSPFYAVNEENNKSFNIVLFNKGDRISEGYKLAIWIGDNKKDGIFKSADRYILPNSSVPLEITIPYEKWGDLNIYELNFAVCSRYQGKWSTTEFANATITKKRDVAFTKIDWKDSGNPPIEMFKGRDGIVEELKEQYCTQNRRYSYVLYGLSRTGKSSILYYLEKAIEGVEISGDNSTKVILPLFIDLGDIYGVVKDSSQFWKRFIKDIYKKAKVFIDKYKQGAIIETPNDFNQFISEMDRLNIHPLFMLDEFSFMQNIIDAGYINSAFLQYMRTISADKDLASFIFAGTYDIKYLIHNPKYNISGAFTYLREPEKPLYEISCDAAEELINMMHGKLDFSPAAIREIHRLTGDVPFWIQKLCFNCALFAVKNNKPDIGVQDLEAVVCKMTGESNKTSYNLSDIPSLNEGTFKNTQMLDTDTAEMKIVLTSIAHLMKDPILSGGVSYDNIKAFWTDNDTDILNYNIMDAIDLLCERKTLVFDDIDNSRLYKFSIDLFRRWWLHKHFEFEPQLSKFKEEKNEHNSF